IEEELDADVLAEQQRIRSQLTKDNTLRPEATLQDTVHICGLRKVYKTDNPQVPFKIAVRDLWFAIPQGQVFGFLGVNGAGKTTTLKMLTGDTHPSSGTAFIYGLPIENQIEARRRIGYCPQFDAIFDLLTAYEHLKFYGTIKGLKGKELEDQIRVLIQALSLNKYKNRKAGTYSGGNKRKLSTAIAMIGNPPVVFLGTFEILLFLLIISSFFGLLPWKIDEPSTGYYFQTMKCFFVCVKKKKNG
ncbi:ABC transporter family protein, partial [Reticulomyxa filosa]